MANLYDNPILGNVSIDTQPYYGALAQSQIAKDKLSTVAQMNPFGQDGIDVDRALLNEKLNTYNTQLQELVKTPALLDDPRNLSNRIFEVRNNFKTAQESGELAPFAQRKRDYDTFMGQAQDALKAAKTEEDRHHVNAQINMFIKKQKSFDGSNKELNYNTGLNGERADFYGRIDALKFGFDVGKETKSLGVALEPTVEDLQNSNYYDAFVQGKTVQVSRDKLFNTIVPAFQSKINEFYRQQQVDPNTNYGFGEDKNFIGTGPQYAIDATTGKPNTNTILGAALASSVEAYYTSDQTKSANLMKSDEAFQAEEQAAINTAKRTASEKTAEVFGKPNLVYESGSTDQKFEGNYKNTLETVNTLTAAAKTRQLNPDEQVKLNKALDDKALVEMTANRLNSTIKSNGETYGEYKAKINNLIKSEIKQSGEQNEKLTQFTDLYLKNPNQSLSELLQTDYLTAINNEHFAGTGKIVNLPIPTSGIPKKIIEKDGKYYTDIRDVGRGPTMNSKGPVNLVEITINDQAGSFETVPDSAISVTVPPIDYTTAKNAYDNFKKVANKHKPELEQYNKALKEKLAAGFITQTLNIDPDYQSEAYKALNNDVAAVFNAAELGEVRANFDFANSPIISSNSKEPIFLGNDENKLEEFKNKLFGATFTSQRFKTRGKEQYLQVMTVKGDEKVTYDLPLSSVGLTKFGGVVADANPNYSKTSYIEGGTRQEQDLKLSDFIQHNIESDFAESKDLRTVFNKSDYKYNGLFGDKKITMNSTSFFNKDGKEEKGTVLNVYNGKSKSVFTFKDYISKMSDISPNLKVSASAPLQDQIKTYINSLINDPNNRNISKDTVKALENTLLNNPDTTLSTVLNIIKDDNKTPMYFNNQTDASKLLIMGSLKKKDKSYVGSFNESSKDFVQIPGNVLSNVVFPKIHKDILPNVTKLTNALSNSATVSGGARDEVVYKNLVSKGRNADAASLHNNAKALDYSLKSLTEADKTLLLDSAQWDNYGIKKAFIHHDDHIHIDFK